METLTLSNVDADDANYMRCVIRAALSDASSYVSAERTKASLVGYIKRHLDSVLRPKDRYLPTAEWSVLLISGDLSGRVGCNRYASFYVKKINTTVVVFYA